MAEVFVNRHKPIFDQLNNPDTIKKVEAMRDKVIKDMESKIQGMRDNRETKSKKIELEEDALKKYKSLKTNDYLNTLRTKINNEKRYNTMAFMVDNGSGKTWVAGNIITVEPKHSLLDEELFKEVARKKSKGMI